MRQARSFDLCVARGTLRPKTFYAILDGALANRHGSQQSSPPQDTIQKQISLLQLQAALLSHPFPGPHEGRLAT